MSTDLRPECSPDEPLVKGSLDHTAGLLVGAEALLEKNLPHLAFHLALLALEEIGKLEVILMGRVSSEEDEAAYQKKFLDDHVGKIFWAFWGPTFSRQMLDQQQIDWHQNLAKKLHEKRLRGLYVEPDDHDFIAPADHVSPKDARDLIDLAKTRLEMQRDNKPADLSDEEKEHLAWFRAARYDQQKKDVILSGRSMKKLAELRSTSAWIKWLHEEDQKRDAELMALGEAEMGREVAEGDMDRPKWKFRIRLKTNSHLIRPKAIKAWSKMGGPIQWFFVDKKKTDQLIVEFMLPKSVHASDLYEVGLAFAYRFIVALNIGSQGFFWFDLPTQTESFDESVEDVETRALLHVGRVPVRRVNRTVEPLKESQVTWTGVAFGLLPNEGPQLEAFRLYLGSLVYWAKTDIHSGFEVQAFHGFFSAFRTAMLLYRDWDGKVAFKDAATAVLSPFIGGIAETMDEVIALADKYVPGEPIPDVNIEQAAVMKLITDVYLWSVLDREAQRRGRIERQKAEAAAVESISVPSATAEERHQ
jgi:AbiV family abortive infection protein